MIIKENKAVNQLSVYSEINLQSAIDLTVEAPYRNLIRTKSTNHFCLFYSVNGRGKISYSDGSYDILEKNEILFTTSNNIRLIECFENTWHFHQYNFQSNGIDYILNKKIKSTLDDNDDFIFDIFSLLNSKTSFDIFVANSRFIKRVSDFLVMYNEIPELMIKSKTPIDDVVEYIKNNITKPLKLKEIIYLFGYSEKKLRNDFLSNLGVLPKQYIIEQKLKKACELLDSTDDTLECISFHIGFSSLPVFMFCFKSKYNMTPTEYRKHLK